MIKELEKFVEFLKKSGYLTSNKDVIKEYEKAFPEKFTSKKEIKKQEKKIPSTFDEAVEYYMEYFKKFDKEIKNMPEEPFVVFCQSPLSGIVNDKIKKYLNLWNKDGELFKFIKNKMKLKDPDDMSEAIIREVYKKTRKNKK